jgi:hypothetical protein
LIVRRFCDQREVLQMSQYKHFSYYERVELARMHHQGASMPAMAERLVRAAKAAMVETLPA